MPRWLVYAAVLLLFARPLGAQQLAALSGVVAEEGGDSPIAEACVTLERKDASRSWQWYTAGDGGFRFEGLVPGSYILRVSRVGYRTFSVALRLPAEQHTTLSVGLAVQPVPIAPLTSHAAQREPFLRERPPNGEIALAESGPARQIPSLATDARELRDRDLSDAVSLGGPDLLRALQRLPGVATRSDYTAELWLRGAAWHETRVRFDEVPIYGSLHAFGVLFALPPAGVGSLWLHPGIRPASIGEGAAGTVDITSRRATDAGAVNAEVDLSMVSVSAAAEARLDDGAAGWSVSARRSIVDRLGTGLLPDLIPYRFADLTGRADVDLGADWTLEASGLWQDDRVAASDGRPAAEWGTAAGRITLGAEKGTLRSRHTLGFSRYRSRLVDSLALPAVFDSIAIAPVRSAGGIDQISVAGVWNTSGLPSRPTWAFGYEAMWIDAVSRGLEPLPLPRPEHLPDGLYDWHGSLLHGALWGEHLRPLDDRTSIQVGLRLETGMGVRGVGSVLPAPRVAARTRVSDHITLSAGLGRSYQYAQALAPTGVHLASLSSSSFWLVAGRDVPLLRADLATAGLLLRAAGGIGITLHGFLRRSNGVVMPPPDQGLLLGRPTFTIGRAEAAGAEAEFQASYGPATTSVAYTFTHSRLESGGTHFTSPHERPHVVHASVAITPLAGLRAGATFTAASGTPYTWAVLTGDPPVPWLGPANSLRSPTFASLDLQLRLAATLFGVEGEVYGQVHNALDRRNGTFYTATQPVCSGEVCDHRAGVANRFEEGVPLLPLVGVRVRF